MPYGIDDYQNAVGAVVTALDAADFALARLKLARARIIHAALPQSYAVPGEATAKNTAAELDGLERALDAAETATAGAGRTRFVAAGFMRG